MLRWLLILLSSLFRLSSCSQRPRSRRPAAAARWQRIFKPTPRCQLADSVKERDVWVLYGDGGDLERRLDWPWIKLEISERSLQRRSRELWVPARRGITSERALRAGFVPHKSMARARWIERTMNETGRVRAMICGWRTDCNMYGSPAHITRICRIYADCKIS